MKKPRRLPLKVLWLAILMMSCTISTPILAQVSTPPTAPAGKPATTPDAPLYTEAQALAAVDAGVAAALKEAIPLAVQAAVAQKEGEAAVLQVRIDGLTSSLSDSIARAAVDAKRARMLEDGLVWGAVGAAVFTAGAFIFGAWAGMTLGR
jgi:hypothetical protein